MRTLERDITEGPRTEILRCVEKHPGVHLRSIERRTDLPLGQVLYHLDRLERMGVVASLRDQGFRRYFVSDVVSRPEKPILAALRHEAPRHIVIALLEQPGMTHKDLLPQLRLAGSTLSFHLHRLTSSGVIERTPDETATRYQVAQPVLTQRVLTYYRESFQDPVVDRYVRSLLANALP